MDVQLIIKYLYIELPGLNLNILSELIFNSLKMGTLCVILIVY